MPSLSDFNIEEELMPLSSKGEVLLKSVYVSVDPYLRGKMNGTHPPVFELNQPLSSKIIAEIVESNNDSFKIGDFVSGYLNWQEYQVSDGKALQRSIQKLLR